MFSLRVQRWKIIGIRARRPRATDDLSHAVHLQGDEILPCLQRGKRFLHIHDRAVWNPAGIYAKVGYWIVSLDSQILDSQPTTENIISMLNTRFLS